MTSFVVSEMRSTKHSIVRTDTTITKSAPHGITLRSVCVRECVRMNNRFMVFWSNVSIKVLKLGACTFDSSVSNAPVQRIYIYIYIYIYIFHETSTNVV